MKKACLAFEAKLTVVKKLNPTGTPTKEELERAALGLFNQVCDITDVYKLI